MYCGTLGARVLGEFVLLNFSLGAHETRSLITYVEIRRECRGRATFFLHHRLRCLYVSKLGPGTAPSGSQGAWFQIGSVFLSAKSREAICNATQMISER